MNQIYEYGFGVSVLECLICMVWWDDGKVVYLIVWYLG